MLVSQPFPGAQLDPNVSFTDFISERVRKRIARLLGTLMAALVVGPLSADQGQGASLLNEILQRYENAQSWRCAFSIRLQVIVDREGLHQPEPYTSIHYRYLYRRHGDEMEFRGRRVLVDAEGNPIPGTTHHIERNFTSDYSALWWLDGTDGQPKRANLTRNVDAERRRVEFDPTSGNFLEGYIYGSSSQSALELIRGAESRRLYPDMEHVNGALCHRIEAETKYGLVTIWTDPARFHNAVRYVVTKRDHHFFNDGLVRDFPKPNKSDRTFEWVAEVNITEWSEVDGVHIPSAGELLIHLKHLDGTTVIIRYQVSRTEISLEPSRQQVPWLADSPPEGVTVYDAATPGITYEWQRRELVPQFDHAFISALDSSIEQYMSGIENRGSRPALSASSALATHPYCGLYDLYAAMSVFGKEVDFADLLKAKYISSDAGSSIAELRTAALDHGLRAMPLTNMSIKILKELPYPAILHVRVGPSSTQPDHFVLFLSSGSAGAKIIDSPASPFVQEVSFHNLAVSWSGTALLLANEPIRKWAVFWGDLRRAITFGAIAIAFILLVRWVGRRSTHLFGTHTKRAAFGWALAQCMGLVVIASACSLTAHVLGEEGFLAHSNSTEWIQRRHVRTFLPRVDAEGIPKLLESRAVLIDARSEDAFRLGHLPNALNVPSTLAADERLAALANIPKDAQIVAYCEFQGCALADVLASNLIVDGYSNISILEGDWSKWSITDQQ